jgi:hypothetical protein
MLATLSLAELRRLTEGQGVTPTDEDLEAVRAFLEVVLPAFDEMERLIPPGTPPAGPEGD